MNRAVVLLFMTYIIWGCHDYSNKEPELFLDKFRIEKITQVEFYPSSYIFDSLDADKEYEGFFP